MINGVLLVLFIGVWVAYKLACWAGEPPRDRTTNHEVGRQS